MSFTVDEDQRYFGVLVRCGKVKQCGVLAKLKSFHPLIKKKNILYMYKTNYNSDF